MKKNQTSQLTTSAAASALLVALGGAGLSPAHAQQPQPVTPAAQQQAQPASARPQQQTTTNTGTQRQSGRRRRHGYRSATTAAAVSSAASATPWTRFRLNPATRVKLDFRNAGIDAVLRTLSQASGIAIVKDPSLAGTLTLESPRQQTLGQAFALLSAALGLRGYQLVKQSDFLIVQQKAVPAPAPSTPSFDFSQLANGGGSGFGGRNQPDLEVYTIKYASATELATVINDVYAQANGSSTAAANPFAAAAAAFGGGGGSGGGRFGGRRGGFGSSAGGGNSQSQNVHASADDFSNSVIVNAPDNIQQQIADIIAQIDKPTDQPQQVRVYKLVYANASDLQPTIQDVLSGTTPVGRGATVTNTNNRNTQSRRQGGFGFFFGGGGGGSNNSNGTVAADSRTNTLVVTASLANLNQIDAIIQQLDKPATYESTTFVYVMKYGRADVVANLLNQAFGNRTTNGAVGGALATNGLAQTTLGSTSSTGSTAPGLNTSNSRNDASNFQVTSANGNENNTTTETTGFNAAGQVVNIRNLAGQVLLVPNIDTNSVIVSSPPEDRQLVEGLLQQLDEVPKQVMIETLVVEATLTKTQELGIDLQNLVARGLTISDPLGAAFAPSATGSTVDASGLPQGAQATLTERGYSAVVRAVAQDQKFNVLSTPRIFATNNATAEINVSQSIPYVSSTEVTSSGVPINSYSFLDVGLILTVTPRILSNGKVIMDITQTDNSLSGYINNQPVTNQREAETTASVLNGNTVVLGGIIQNSVTETVNKVPLLGDIPVLGNLFRSTNKAKNRTELLVFLTPHVVATDSDAEDLRKNTEQELGASTQNLLPKSGPTDAGAPNQK